jgi:hypothetical protein
VSIVPISRLAMHARMFASPFHFILLCVVHLHEQFPPAHAHCCPNLILTSEHRAPSHPAFFASVPSLSQHGQGLVVAMPQPVCGRVQVHPRAGPSATRVQDRAVRSVRVHAQAQAGGAARHNLSSRYLVILSLRRLSALLLFFSAHSSSRSLSHQLLQNFPRSHGPLFFKLPNVSFSFSRVAFLTLLLVMHTFRFTAPRLAHCVQPSWASTRCCKASGKCPSACLATGHRRKHRRRRADTKSTEIAAA